ncbi:MAG: hypothetical protein LQ340_006530 [Diploschistes diacapsis]|nr:MAG: hypothetical protein LQ340_006530 [Diploschistes diacapsis]
MDVNTSPFPTWTWPDAAATSTGRDDTVNLHHRVPGHFEADEPSTSTLDSQQPQSQPHGTQSQPDPADQERHWPSRTCRICLETVPPTFHMPPDSLPSFLQSRKPRVTYISEDPTLGRLIRPCKCKGSSRYVHEGCLRTWRHSDAGYSVRNYWSCPTCGFRYRLQRLGWGKFLRSTGVQLGLTMVIFVIVVFALGFVADPLISLYVDPYDTIASGMGGVGDSIGGWPEEKEGWTEHFVKGFAGLGLLGFLKAILAMSWWNWLRAFPGGGGVRVVGSTGRDRVHSLNFAVILIGAGTFLWTLYKGVRAWSRKTLDSVSEKVMDVPLDDDEEEFVDEDEATPKQEAGGTSTFNASS